MQEILKIDSNNISLNRLKQISNELNITTADLDILYKIAKNFNIYNNLNRFSNECALKLASSNNSEKLYEIYLTELDDIFKECLSKDEYEKIIRVIKKPFYKSELEKPIRTDMRGIFLTCAQIRYPITAFLIIFLSCSSSRQSLSDSLVQTLRQIQSETLSSSLSSSLISHKKVQNFIEKHKININELTNILIRILKKFNMVSKNDNLNEYENELFKSLFEDDIIDDIINYCRQQDIKYDEFIYLIVKLYEFNMQNSEKNLEEDLEHQSKKNLEFASKKNLEIVLKEDLEKNLEIALEKLDKDYILTIIDAYSTEILIDEFDETKLKEFSLKKYNISEKLQEFKKVIENNYKELTYRLKPIDCLSNDIFLSNIYETINNYKQVIIERIEKLSLENDMMKLKDSIKDIITKINSEININELYKTITKFNINSETEENIKRLLDSSFNDIFISNLIFNYAAIKLMNNFKDESQIYTFLHSYRTITNQYLNNYTGICTLLSLRYVKNILERNKYQDFIKRSLRMNYKLNSLNENFETIYEKYVKIKNNDEFCIEYERYLREIFSYDNGLKDMNLILSNANIILTNDSIDISHRDNYDNIFDSLINKIIYDRISTSIIYEDNISYSQKFVLYSLIDNNNIFLKEHPFLFFDEQEYNESCEKLKALNFGINNMMIYSSEYIENISKILKSYKIIENDVKEDDLDYNYGYIDTIMYRAYEIRYITSYISSFLNISENKLLDAIFNCLLCYNHLHNTYIYSLFTLSNNLVLNALYIISKYSYLNRDDMFIEYSKKFMKDELYKDIFTIIYRDYKKIHENLHTRKIFEEYSYRIYYKYITYDDSKKTIKFDIKIIELIKRYKIFELLYYNRLTNTLENVHTIEQDISTLNYVLIFISNYIFEIKLRKYLKNNKNKLFTEIIGTSQLNYNIYESLSHCMAVSYEYTNNELISRTLDPNLNIFTVLNYYIFSYVNEFTDMFENSSKKYIDNNIYHALKHMSAGNINENMLKYIIIIILVFLLMLLIISIVVTYNINCDICKEDSKRRL